MYSSTSEVLLSSLLHGAFQARVALHSVTESADRSVGACGGAVRKGTWDKHDQHHARRNGSEHPKHVYWIQSCNKYIPSAGLVLTGDVSDDPELRPASLRACIANK